MSTISPLENATFYGHQRITLQHNLHIESTSGLSFLMHGFITLSDTMSNDKYDVSLTGHETVHYLFDIHLCSVEGKCWKLSEVQKIHYMYFLSFFLSVFSTDLDSEEP